MTAIGGILTLVASLGMLVFGIQILIKAFQQSIWWGLGYLFVPFVGLFYIIMFWDDAKKPFLYSLACAPVLVIGMVLAGAFSGDLSAGM